MAKDILVEFFQQLDKDLAAENVTGMNQSLKQ